MAIPARAASPATPFSRAERPGFFTRIRQGFGDLRTHNRLIGHLVSADLKRTHADTLFGELWWIIDPFLQMVIYTLLVTVIFNKKIPDAPLFLFCAILPWKWFQTTLNDAVTSVTSRSNLIRQIQFPKLVLPTAAVLAGTLSFTFGLVSLAALYVVYPHRLSHWLLTLPIIAFVEFMFMLSLAVFVSAANAFYRDVQNVLRHVLRLWFYLSPAIYSIDQLEHSSIKYILYLNPMTPILESYRNISYSHLPPDWLGLAWVLVLSLILLCLGFAFFKRVEPGYAKIL
jgi:ABC-type polysaccharide/polyol phosphate export permease